MDILVKGGQVLSGEITPSGSKNSALHIIPATLLFDEVVTLENIPNIADVSALIETLNVFGGKVKWEKDKNRLTIDNSSIKFTKLESEGIEKIKASSLFWGGMLARFRRVDFGNLPGGCTLGIRPFEPFYKSFRDFGVVIKDSGNGVVMDASKAKATDIWMTEMAVSVTSTLIMLAVTLKGKTTITGSASEPQVQDLCNFLSKAGARISGVGSSILTIEGGTQLSGVSHNILSDHNEIATFLALSACTGGGIKVHNSIPEYFKQINYEFSKFNIEIEYDGDTAILKKNQKIKLLGTYKKKTHVVRAQPWPGLPVDILPVFIPLALSAPDGYMMYHNWMYESGLFWTSEINKLGGEVIMSDPHRIIVMAGKKLKGSTLEAPYIIRAVVALAMSAMIAEGESKILDADALYRGHPNFAKNLTKLGAKIEVVEETSR